MKKISVLFGALLLIGCGQEPEIDKEVTQQAKKEVEKVEVQEELFTENGKEFVEFAIKDEFESLSNEGEVQITEYFPLYTADEVTSNYDKNEIRANNLYKNKQFFITGNIGGIEAGIDDKPVVNFKTKANYGFNSPLLSFNKIDYEKIADLNKGEKVTFFCTGKSEIAGTPILGNCLFLDTFEKQIINDILNFKDQDLSGKNSEYKQVIFTYTTMMLGFDKVSNGFEQCSKKDTSCIEKILKTSSKEDIKKAFEDVKETFPKASASDKENSK